MTIFRFIEMKISIIAGARPNFMKIAPLMRAAKASVEAGNHISLRLIYTGNVNDESIEPSLFHDLDMPAPDVYLHADSTDFFHRFSEIMLRFSEELNEHPADVVLVVDDLTPTMACSFVARKKGVRIAHLVAGTHSFDFNRPKELNKVITDALSDILFTAGMNANRNLSQTGKQQKDVYFVGNILIDTLRHNRERWRKPACLDSFESVDNGYVLLTMNRHAIVDDVDFLRKLVGVLLSKVKVPIIAPVHAYVAEKLHSLCNEESALHILPPLDYLSFAYLEGHAKAIITDSGNIAEEATFLGIPCITLNEVAAHPETVSLGTNLLVGYDMNKLHEALGQLNEGTWKNSSIPERWDGHTAERIIQILLDQQK